MLNQLWLGKLFSTSSPKEKKIGKERHTLVLSFNVIKSDSWLQPVDAMNDAFSFMIEKIKESLLTYWILVSTTLARIINCKSTLKSLKRIGDVCCHQTEQVKFT